MTRQTVARWTCNACAVEVETSTDRQPTGWVGYGFTAPDTPAGERADIGHLCARCARRVNSALEEN